MNAAISVFADAGFASGTTSAIAEQARISEAQLFYHFANKRELLAAVLDERDRIADDVAGPIPTDGQAIPEAILRIAASNATMPAVVRLYMTIFAEATTPTHPGHQYYRDRYVRLRERFLQAFDVVNEQGLLAPGIDAAYAADSTLALWDGIQLQWLLDPTSVDVVDHLRRHLRAITTIC